MQAISQWETQMQLQQQKLNAKHLNAATIAIMAVIKREKANKI